MHLPFSLASLPALPSLSSLRSLQSFQSLQSLQSLSLSSLSLPSLDELSRISKSITTHPKMLSIATLFDDEQRLLNRLWIVLLGLQALLVLFGTVSAVVRGVVAMRRSSDTLIPTTRKGGLRRGPSQYPRHVTIELPATVYEYADEKSDYNYQYDYQYEHYDYDDGYAEAYSNSADYDEYEHSEKYPRSVPAHILNSPSQKV